MVEHSQVAIGDRADNSSIDNSKLNKAMDTRDALSQIAITHQAVSTKE